MSRLNIKVDIEKVNAKPEFAKSRAMRASVVYVPTPHVPTCQRAKSMPVSHFYVPTCQRRANYLTWRANVPTCQFFNLACQRFQLCLTFANF